MDAQILIEVTIKLISNEGRALFDRNIKPIGDMFQSVRCIKGISHKLPKKRKTLKYTQDRVINVIKKLKFTSKKLKKELLN